MERSREGRCEEDSAISLPTFGSSATVTAGGMIPGTRSTGTTASGGASHTARMRQSLDGRDSSAGTAVEEGAAGSAA